MGDNEGFFQLILLGVGVLSVFLLIIYLPNIVISEPWGSSWGDSWKIVGEALTPIILIIGLIGFIVYLVVNR